MPRRITLDDVARLPRPGLAVPGKLAFSPDGRYLTLLRPRGEGLERRLFIHDVATGAERELFAPPGSGLTEANVSLEEALRRERARVHDTGVTDYAWARRAAVILVPLLGELWLVDPAGGAPRLVAAEASEAQLSPDGTQAAFLRQGELWLVDAAGGGERRLTHDAAEGVFNGQAEFAAQEELGRRQGFWWSDDGRRLAFTRVDERHVPIYTIPHLAADPPRFEQHRYPFAGAANARVGLGVIDAAGGPARWLAWEAEWEYLARVAWHPDGRLLVQLLTRDQRRLELRAYAPEGGSYTTLLREEASAWLHLHDDLRVLRASGELVWSGDRDGKNSLALHAPDGRKLRDLSGDVAVDQLLELDESGRRVAFLGTRNPRERHLWMASLDRGGPERLTREPGFHDACFTRDLGVWAELHHSTTAPPRLTLRPAERVLHSPPVIEVALPAPRAFSFRNRDGVELDGLAFLPARLPAPLVVHCYGGPGSQLVTAGWTATTLMRAQYLAQEGFSVIVVDNRGTPRRGVAFEAAVAGRMGTIEIDDQADGVRYAREQGWARPGPAAIGGWSYGGFVAIQALLRAPEVFAVAVAGAPVTDLAGYDTAWTERYMGLPADNPEGYRAANAVAQAAGLRGQLLLIHGMLDENVHFRHSARLIDALMRGGRRCELLLYPGERHSPREERVRAELEGRIVEFLRRHLDAGGA